MELQQVSEKNIDQKLDAILSKLNSTIWRLYAKLTSPFREYFCKTFTSSSMTLGGIATTIYCWTNYTSHKNDYNQGYDLFKQQGCYNVKDCGYYYSSWDEICKQLWSSTCINSTLADQFMAGGIACTVVAAFSMCCSIGHFWPTDLILKDYLKREEINFLSDYKIRPYPYDTESMYVQEAIIANGKQRIRCFKFRCLSSK